MNKAKVTELKTMLFNHDFTDKTKLAAKKILKGVGMYELIEAERNVIEEGEGGIEAAKFDNDHLKSKNQDLLRESLTDDHPISIMIKDHDRLLLTLSELEKVNKDIAISGVTKSSFLTLKKLAKELEKAETHQKKEEKLLFPELEKRGIEGPVEMMRAEHLGFHEHRKELSLLLSNPKAYFNFRSEVDRIIKYLTYHMKEHIFKENNILYPEALGAIDDPRIWRKIKNKIKR